VRRAVNTEEGPFSARAYDYDTAALQYCTGAALTISDERSLLVSSHEVCERI
jgi:hypothetical protein